MPTTTAAPSQGRRVAITVTLTDILLGLILAALIIFMIHVW
jgi:hypothetical protein